MVGLRLCLGSEMAKTNVPVPEDTCLNRSILVKVNFHVNAEFILDYSMNFEVPYECMKKKMGFGPTLLITTPFVVLGGD